MPNSGPYTFDVQTTLVAEEKSPTTENLAILKYVSFLDSRFSSELRVPCYIIGDQIWAIYLMLTCVR